MSENTKTEYGLRLKGETTVYAYDPDQKATLETARKAVVVARREFGEEMEIMTREVTEWVRLEDGA